jgi:hypothetical protein
VNSRWTAIDAAILSPTNFSSGTVVAGILTVSNALIVSESSQLVIENELEFAFGASLTIESNILTSAIVVNGMLSFNRNSTVTITDGHTSSDHYAIDVSECITFGGNLSVIINENIVDDAQILLFRYACRSDAFTSVSAIMASPDASATCTPLTSIHYGPTVARLLIRLRDENGQHFCPTPSGGLPLWAVILVSVLSILVTIGMGFAIVIMYRNAGKLSSSLSPFDFESGSRSQSQSQRSTDGTPPKEETP